jgi:hypothetical protein
MPHHVLALVLLVAPSVALAQQPKPEVVDLAGVAKASPNAARGVALWFDQDRGNLQRAYPVGWSASRDGRFAKFYADWSAALAKLDAAKQNEETKTAVEDLKKRVGGLAVEHAKQAAERAGAAVWVPFAVELAGLEDARRRAAPLDAEKTADVLNRLKKAVQASAAAFELEANAGEVRQDVARTTAAAVDELLRGLHTWTGFYTGYDPLFNWWCVQPAKELDAALVKYADVIKAAKDLPAGHPVTPIKLTPTTGPSDVPDLAKLLDEPRSEMATVLERYRGASGSGRVPGGSRGEPPSSERAKAWLAALKKDVEFDKLSRAGQVDYLLFQHQLTSQVKSAELRAKLGQPALSPPDKSGIRGRPIGGERLANDLAAEMIPHTPQELIDLAEREYEWCLVEMKKASREMGFGDDWKRAVEKVKTLHVPPGKQPELVHELSDEAVAFVRKRNLLTVPPLCDETWRMTMLSPERQLTSPFFLGGEVVMISFPTDAMPHEAKLQSMRGNNRHFSKATVHHELIPGHGLQQYYTARSNTHRGGFGTPFWTEGWALYMEFVLYDAGFPTSPEDRVGMLFWRMHRCARVVFSLGFHTGTMLPQQCTDYLVEKVGHEPDNAAAEVRRSFEGGYGPLYQLAYLIGGAQFRALRKELVESGKMTETAYHDAVLRANRMPVAMVRALLTDEKLSADGPKEWKFWTKGEKGLRKGE